MRGRNLYEPDISERSFEEAVECALLQHGPGACARDSMAVCETPNPLMPQPKPTGYSGTPLIRKLGIAPGSRVLPMECPSNYRLSISRSS
jgi:hypothetical protein